MLPLTAWSFSVWEQEAGTVGNVCDVMMWAGDDFDV